MTRKQVIHNFQGRKQLGPPPDNSLNCTKRTIKGTGERNFQPQYIHFDMQALDNAEIICYDRKIYVPPSMQRRMLDWYHIYLNHPGGSRLAKTPQKVCYRKGLFTQAELFANISKICQQLKKRKTLYRHLPPHNIAEQKPWDMVHVDLIGSYSRSIRKHQESGTIIINNDSLN